MYKLMRSLGVEEDKMNKLFIHEIEIVNVTINLQYLKKLRKRHLQILWESIPYQPRQVSPIGKSKHRANATL